MRTSVFLRTWRRSDYWAVTTLQPGKLPAKADRTRYADAVSGLEQTGHYASASAAWQAGLSHWPNDVIMQFGLANTEFALGNFSAAEHIYLHMLSIDSGLLIARNNLAMAMAAQGRNSEAREQIDTALQLAVDSPFLEELLDTQEMILSPAQSSPN
jgi:tetratricopeptide (TPR) repeat protein